MPKLGGASTNGNSTKTSSVENLKILHRKLLAQQNGNGMMETAGVTLKNS